MVDNMVFLGLQDVHKGLRRAQRCFKWFSLSLGCLSRLSLSRVSLALSLVPFLPFERSASSGAVRKSPSRVSPVIATARSRKLVSCPVKGQVSDRTFFKWGKWKVSKYPEPSEKVKL